MGILPRRRLAAAPAEPATPQTVAKGASGRYNTHGFLDLDEINTGLRGRQGLARFDEMWRTDSDVRKSLTLIVSAMVAGTWDVQEPGDENEPASEEEQRATELVRFALFEAMRPKLPAHLWTALTVAGRFGFAPFEQVWKLADWQGREVWVPDTLDLRLPRSVDRFEQDGSKLAAIEQFAPGTRDGVAISKTHIPASDLVFYRFGAEGDNWEGQSLLRPAYKHWKYKAAIERIQVMGIERTALGVPTGYPPQGASEDQLDAFAEFLENVRASDATFFMAPGPRADHTNPGEGWIWEFVTPGASQGDSKAIPDALKYHSDKIAGSVLQEFMRQGMDKVGTNATADTQQDPFLKLCEAIVTIVVEDTINEQLIPRLVDLNFTVDRYPTLSCSLIDATTLTELATYVKTLSDAGALRPEPTLEAFLRERADLPEADEAAIKAKADEEAAQAQADAELAHAHAVQQIQAKGQTAPPKQMSLEDMPDAIRTLARQDRDLKPHEADMQLDRIEAAIDGARSRFESAAGPHVLQLARELALEARAGDRIAAADPPEPLITALVTELAALYQTGKATVRDELIAQATGYSTPVTLAAFDRGDVGASAIERLRARAVAAADAIRAAIVQALHRTALHRGTGPADLQLAAERAASGALRAAAQDHAAGALNAGRADQADADSDMIAGSYYTSLLDGNRCTHCARADDDVLRPLDDPVRLAHVPPNPDCQGGARCRCMEAFRFKSEAAAAV